MLALLVSNMVMTMLCACSDEHVLFADDTWGELETYVVFSDNIEPSLEVVIFRSQSRLRRSLLMKVQLVENYLIKKG